MILNTPALKLKQEACGDFRSPYSPAIDDSREADLLLHTSTNYVTKRLQPMIESEYFRVNRLMPGVSGFHSFNTARCTICGFESMLLLRKDLDFSGAWTVREQN